MITFNQMIKVTSTLPPRFLTYLGSPTASQSPRKSIDHVIDVLRDAFQMRLDPDRVSV